LKIIDAKTAALFSAAAEVGAAISGRPEVEQAALRSYGRSLGIAFQLVDDALDYAGDAAKLGKSVGDDFREGKITLPVIVAFQRGTAVDRAFWQRTVGAGDADDTDLQHAISLMRAHQSIEATFERARHFGAKAREALAVFPASPAKQAMLDVVAFSIIRAH
jgi:octaprenyl-diphosphate synthase